MSKINYKGILYEPTRKVKVSFEGTTQEFNTYKIPIHELHYNRLNGRIGTYIKKYDADNSEPLKDLLLRDKEKFNDIIQRYIIDSDKRRYKETKEDIRKREQLEYGVILKDGTIIDGNRRFTALRELYEETREGKFEYFETIIFEVPDTSLKEKSIKRFEIQLQHGKDEKVDYSPIQVLVDIYTNTMVEGSLLNDVEYAADAGLKMAKYNQLKQRAEIMVDFCKYFNIPEQFHIVDELKLDGPINEIRQIRNNYEKAGMINEYNSIVRPLIYTTLISAKEGDITREIRPLKPVKNFDYIKQVKTGNDEIMKDIFDKMRTSPKNDEIRVISEIRNDKNTKKLLDDVFDIKLNVHANNKRQDPSNFTKNALNELSKINKNQLSFIRGEEKREIRKGLNDIQLMILELQKIINEEE